MKEKRFNRLGALLVIIKAQDGVTVRVPVQHAVAYSYVRSRLILAILKNENNPRSRTR